MRTIHIVNDRGYTLAAVLTLLAIMAIFLMLAVPLWSRVKQRDNEEELIFRGNEYIKAIARYHAKFGSYPPDVETLVKLKYLRHEYLDPMTKSGKWKVLHPDALAQTGQAGTITTPGGKSNNLVNDDKNRNTNSGSSFGNDRDDNDNADKDNKDGLSSDDDENKDEEPEVESVGPVVGVVSRSKKASMKILNGQTYYNKWIFVYALQQQQPQQRPPQPPPGGTPNTGPNTRPPGSSGGARPPTPNPNPNPTPNPNPQDSGDDDDDGGGN